MVYIFLAICYKVYLDYSEGGKYYPDYFTNLVAYQTEALSNTLGYDTQVLKHPDEPSMKVIFRGKYLARIIEGCNGISVIILFVAFIVAFAEKWKPTLVFIFAGSALIYAVNLIRIVLLYVGMYHYPWRQELLHSTLFPFVIYSMVFLLWMFWVNRYAKLKQRHA